MRFDFLHGFLGLPEDGKVFQSHGVAWELWSKSSQKIENFKTAFASELSASTHGLAVGYGMGGRILLELMAHGVQWERVILMSVHPGLEHVDARAERRKNDALWANRFRTEAWTDLVHRWDSQEVFRETTRVDRLEEDFDREQLAMASTNWSLGATSPAWGFANTPRVTWVYGERDLKMRPVAASLRQKGAKVAVVRNAGHRVGWDRPDWIRNAIVTGDGRDEADDQTGMDPAQSV